MSELVPNLEGTDDRGTTPASLRKMPDLIKGETV
jgi:hypothetical protein